MTLNSQIVVFDSGQGRMRTRYFTLFNFRVKQYGAPSTTYTFLPCLQMTLKFTVKVTSNQRQILYKECWVLSFII